jgi:hypothetical protein
MQMSASKIKSFSFEWFLNFLPTLMAFRSPPRFLKWSLDSTFFFIFFVTLGGQPFSFRRPSWFLNLPITVSGLAKVAIFTTNVDAENQFD